MPAKRGPLVSAKMPWEAPASSGNSDSHPRATTRGAASTSTTSKKKKSTTTSTTRNPVAAASLSPSTSARRMMAETGRQQERPAAVAADVEEAVPEPESADDVPEPAQPAGALYHSDADFGSEQPAADVDLVRCNTCGRSFAADRIQKHQVACGKAAKKRRPVYNATAARLEADALKAFQQGEAHAPVETATKPKKPKKWKQEHEFLMQNIRAAKGTSNGGDDGSAPPAPSAPDPSLVQCPHCGRRFSETAAERHIPICQSLKTKPVGAKGSPARGGPGRGGGGGLLAPAATMPAPASSPSASKPTRSRPGEKAEREACPHCGRNFEHSAFLRHVDICSKVKSKPKQMKR